VKFVLEIKFRHASSSELGEDPLLTMYGVGGIRIENRSSLEESMWAEFGEDHRNTGYLFKLIRFHCFFLKS
jgi:hypothetical protein